MIFYGREIIIMLSSAITRNFRDEEVIYYLGNEKDRDGQGNSTENELKLKHLIITRKI